MATSTISSLLSSAERGDGSAADALFSALYAELHRLARSQLKRSGGGLTIGATTLLHEAYLDMSQRSTVFPDRSRFMAYAAKVMRRLLIDYARNRQAQKRGGAFEITALTSDVSAPAADGEELARIGAAVDELAQEEPELAQVVDLKFFCGFSFAEIGALRGHSERTVQRHWKKARLYLHRTLRDAAVS
jgi:RNA polymerase sigma factor (TIGR02999 family)